MYIIHRAVPVGVRRANTRRGIRNVLRHLPPPPPPPDSLARQIPVWCVCVLFFFGHYRSRALVRHMAYKHIYIYTAISSFLFVFPSYYFTGVVLTSKTRVRIGCFVRNGKFRFNRNERERTSTKTDDTRDIRAKSTAATMLARLPLSQRWLVYTCARVYKIMYKCTYQKIN